jgi:FKBP-type peptidyl-prolyl cis-trans isomerase
MYHKTNLKMKKISVLMVMAAIGMIVASCGNGSNTNVNLKTETDSVYYAIGAMWGPGMKGQLQTLPGIEAGKENYDAFIAAFVTAFKDETKIKMTPEEAQAYVQKFIELVQAKEFESKKAEGEAFLASNRGQAGVITTTSGLQYKVITEGTGKKPTAENIVIVHYTGKFLDGTVFDSSVERGEPTEFPVSGTIIPVWTEVLQLMPVGSKYQVWIPYNLGYGESGWQGIPPFSTLDFEVELLGIKE